MDPTIEYSRDIELRRDRMYKPSESNAQEPTAARRPLFRAILALAVAAMLAFAAASPAWAQNIQYSEQNASGTNINQASQQAQNVVGDVDVSGSNAALTLVQALLQNIFQGNFPFDDDDNGFGGGMGGNLGGGAGGGFDDDDNGFNDDDDANGIDDDDNGLGTSSAGGGAGTGAGFDDDDNGFDDDDNGFDDDDNGFDDDDNGFGGDDDDGFDD